MSACLFYLVKTNSNFSTKQEIPLKQVETNIQVIDNIAQFTLIQQYSNTEDQALEISYTFPTPAYATVYDFQAKIGDVVVKGDIQEKETAKKNYNKAVSDGHGAYLAERVEGDVFSLALGNVPPKTDIEITIRYVIALKSEIDSTQLLLEFPTTIMPRYVSSSANVQHGKRVNPDKVDFKPYEFKISGSIYMSDGIVSIDSKNSQIKLANMKEKSLDFVIDNIQNLDKTLLISIKRNQPKSTATYEKFDGQLTDETFRYCSMINLVPDFTNVKKTEVDEIHYTIVLDTSGSMCGNAMTKTIEAASLFVSMLPTGSSFDIYQFASHFSKFTHDPKIQVGSVESKQQACTWISQLYANGGTELYPVLIDVYKSIKNISKAGIILLLTDGGISEVEETLRLVKSNPNVNVFTIGIGDSVSTQLVEGIATNGNGHCELVTTDDIKPKVISQLRRSQQSVRRFQKCNEIRLTIDGEFKLVPENIPPLYENDNNIFFVFSQNQLQSFQYIQKLDENNIITHNVELTESQVSGSPAHRIAALKYVENLSTKKQGSQLEHLKEDVNKDEIVKVCIDIGIISIHTSFLAVEYREGSKKILTPCEVRHVPLQAVDCRSSSGSSGRYCLSAATMSSYSPSACAFGAPKTKSSSSSGSGGAIQYESARFCGMSLPTSAGSSSRSSSNSRSSAKGAQSSSHRSSEKLAYAMESRSDEVDEEDQMLSGLGNMLLMDAPDLYANMGPKKGGLIDPLMGTTSNGIDDASTGLSNNTVHEICSVEVVNLCDVQPRKQKKESTKITPNYTISSPLPKCTWVTTTILMSVDNGSLPVGAIDENTIIEITSNGEYNGLYRLTSVGSTKEPWVLEKIN